MRHLKLPIYILGLAIATSAGLTAQEAGDSATPEEERIYLQEEPEWDKRQRAFGIGIGLVELGDNVVEGQVLTADDDVETYFTINLRLPIGDREAHGSYGRRGGFRAYVEPEIGYWESDFTTDMLLGVNLIGAMPLNAVEFFVGGGIGAHFLDVDDRLIGNAVVLGDSDTALGVNAQFGVDVALGKKTGVFAAGRFDLVDDSRDEFEGKAYLGLRVRF